MKYPSIRGYEIVDVLGEGGMGTVYLARQLSLNRQVAIKILPEHLASNESYVMRFHQEAKAAARIKHTGIVQIYDAGEDNGFCYFVMEYIDGETTGRRVRRKGRLDEASALLISESVAVALEYAWGEEKLVHRDIKPDNILIDGDGTVKVADLGLAKLVNQSSAMITMSKMLIGTPHYCAPEQAQGELEVDFRSDIYALGATLYHFLTGHAPFSETSGVSAMVRNITDYLPDPMDCCPDVSEPVAWLIEKMMAKNRNNRHRNWGEVLKDIDMVMAGKFPVSERIPEGSSTVMRGAQRARRNADYEQKMAARKPGISGGGLTSPFSSSLRFKVFLIVAAVFTLILYVMWFRAENKRRSVNPLRRLAIERFVR